ncbi:MAG: hypothetical protein AAFZ02_04795 [Pseudomonadota bacterium]
MDSLAAAGTPQELRKAWEQYTTAFGRLVGKSITLLKDKPETRGRGDKLHKLSNDQDEGLRYLRLSRNATEHSLDLPAQYSPGTAVLGNGLVALPPNTHVQFSNFAFNQEAKGNFEVKTGPYGFPQDLKGPVQAAFVPANIKLKEVKTVHNGKQRIAPVPKTVWGNAIRLGSPGALADGAYKGLVEFLSQD